MDSWDDVLNKLAAVIFMLFLILSWPNAITFVKSIYLWYFLLALIIFATKLIYIVYL